MDNQVQELCEQSESSTKPKTKTMSWYDRDTGNPRTVVGTPVWNNYIKFGQTGLYEGNYKDVMFIILSRDTHSDTKIEPFGCSGRTINPNMSDEIMKEFRITMALTHATQLEMYTGNTTKPDVILIHIGTQLHIYKIVTSEIQYRKC